MRKVVGISQRVRLSWLDAVPMRIEKSTSGAELRSFLNSHLSEELPGPESRAKTSGIIMRIWCAIPLDRIPLRDRALELLPRITSQERIFLHWGMAALAYPFFRDTAEVIGRLLALQDDFTTAQVQDRMLTSWGDRTTSSDAVQRLITTFVDWGILCSTKARGHFVSSKKISTDNISLQLWLLEALLKASSSDEIEAQQLLRLPESYPFSISVGVHDLRKDENFTVHRQGLDMDMIALPAENVAPSLKVSKSRKKDNVGEVMRRGLFND